MAGGIEVVAGGGESQAGVFLRADRGNTFGVRDLQCMTAIGNVVLASDASHFYENIAITAG